MAEFLPPRPSRPSGAVKNFSRNKFALISEYSTCYELSTKRYFPNLKAHTIRAFGATRFCAFRFGTFQLVGAPRFELGLKRPKRLVLPLHYGPWCPRRESPTTLTIFRLFGRRPASRFRSSTTRKTSLRLSIPHIRNEGCVFERPKLCFVPSEGIEPPSRP